ncbi:hypothetical protein SCARD494_07288 [Seiridium cardinale]
MGLTLNQKQKSILAMSKSEYLTHIGNHDHKTKLQVAAAIFRIDVQSSRPTILLLKRSKHDSQRPGTFEAPSGSVKDSDFIISDSVARAVEENSSLRVFRIAAMLREKRWLDKRSWLDEDDDIVMPSTGLRKHVQLNWAVAVDATRDVAIRSDEHEEFIWASWNVLDRLNLREDTRDFAKEALTWAARCLC